MTARFVATIGAAILAVLIATPAFTCTTLCLFETGRALVAYNYDFSASEGLDLVNKRGTSKKSRVEHQGASWTARHASVAEVVANAEAVRPPSRGPAPIHYLFADASGDAAAIEFLDGKLVVHRGETLPVKALTNSTYADSLVAFEAARRAGEMPTSRSSLDRFVRGHAGIW